MEKLKPRVVVTLTFSEFVELREKALSEREAAKERLQSVRERGARGKFTSQELELKEISEKKTLERALGKLELLGEIYKSKFDF